jgi:sterol desaturase/sphingolipid hydroxylase (fatty acid hydroxylase superfamily)
MGHLMTGPSSEVGAAPDYSRRAGLCVEVLGWLTLLRLDLLGLLLIKAGRGVRARDRKWWKVAVALWTLHLAVWLVIGAVAATIGGSVRIFGKAWTIPLGPWMVATFGLIGLALVVPFFWLLAPATRRAMNSR